MLFHLSSVVYLGATALTWATAEARKRAPHGVVKRELVSFEERYINTLNWQLPNSTVKLIGCKKMKLAHKDVKDFEDDYYHPPHYAEYQEFNSHFYDEASMELRIYFPVADALVEHGGSMISANPMGEFEVEDIHGDYAVLGRYQNEYVHGVSGNIIKDGVIYLAEKVSPHRQVGNVYVYDFGYKDLHDHHYDLKPRGDSNPDAPNNGCVKNHGGENCSKKYGISEGRCPMRNDTCMDYNGFRTDCDKTKRLQYFIGSDCSVAVSRGQCWNEMVTAAEGLPLGDKIAGIGDAVGDVIGDIF
jgi:hypothetical protein